MLNSTPQELKLVVQDAGLEPTKVESLISQFGGFFNLAKQVVELSKDITVTSEDQTEEMENARTSRLALKKIRVDTENLRKQLKEQSLREGKAIDGVANIIKALIVPVEEHLEKQEKFAEELQRARKALKINGRKIELQKYVPDVSLFNLEEMSNEAFENLLENSKQAYFAQIEAEKKAEEERIAKEKADVQERERIRLENEKLRKKAQETENRLIEERKKAEIDKSILEFNLAEERKKQREALEKERKEKEALEKKIKEEEAVKRVEEAKKIEAERQATLAPDKEKMRVIYRKIDELAAEIELVDFTSTQCANVAQETTVGLEGILRKIAMAMKTL